MTVNIEDVLPEIQVVQYDGSNAQAIVDEIETLTPGVGVMNNWELASDTGGVATFTHDDEPDVHAQTGDYITVRGGFHGGSVIPSAEFAIRYVKVSDLT